jgi:N-acetylglucosaminyldiphosphoundecaprenol N-acetyl-beta-D-mannosaminyltransferase
MDSKKSIIFGIPVDKLTMQQSIDEVEKAIAENRQIHHTVINAGKVVAMQKDPLLRDSVLAAQMINADGQAIVWAARLLGKPVPERVAGIDLMLNLVADAHIKGRKIYLFGAKDEVVNEVVRQFGEQYSTELIAGYRNGYYEASEERAIAAAIGDSGAHMLFVAMTSPKKEIFLDQFKDELSHVNFIMGVGGSFDVVAGKVKRAPVWMQNVGLEWAYRFLQEPGRMWKRYLVGNTKFIMLTLGELIRRR